ncbi:MAG: ATP-binding protein [Candidatus Methanofastidiosia archaeon]
MKNPYITRKPIKDSDGFFGRGEILKEIFEDIGWKKMQSRCIIGERRIGKTSLLYQIMNNEMQEKYFGKIESTILVRTDITLFPNAYPADFFEEWAKDISQVLKETLPEEPGYLSFRKLVENVTDEEYKIVILLDEFEATAYNDNLGKDFFEFLRALTQNYDISFILFGRVPLQYLMRDEKFSSTFSSPFFNIINISYLGFLEEKEATKLVEEPAQEAGIDITEYTDFILENTYHHPFLLQLLSSIVFDFKQSSNTNHEQILKEFKIQTEDFFTYLWQHSNLDEQEALKKLALQDKDISQIILNKLDRRSLLTKDKDKIFCPLFEEFIKKI